MTISPAAHEFASILPGALIEVAPGILWTRFALPFALNHINVYLLEDEGGWAVVDTGFGDAITKQAWQSLLSGPLRGRPLTRLIVTHHHSDHVGMAGWLVEEFGIPVHMTDAEYLLAQHYSVNAQIIDGVGYRDFYLRHGMESHYADLVISMGHRYKRTTTGLPWTYHQLIAGEDIVVGGRRFEILTGGGHSSEQAMLFCREDNIFLAADQVMLRISPNISVAAINPEGDPLGQYLRSLKQIREHVPDTVLVLPGHERPFRTLHRRIGELAAHHEARCDLVEKACSGGPKTAAEILPVLFDRPLDPHQMSFAFSETLAHVNRMVREGRLSWVPDGNLRRAVVA